MSQLRSQNLGCRGGLGHRVHNFCASSPLWCSGLWVMPGP